MKPLVVALAVLLSGCGSTVFVTMGCGASLKAATPIYGSLNIATEGCGAQQTQIQLPPQE